MFPQTTYYTCSQARSTLPDGSSDRNKPNFMFTFSHIKGEESSFIFVDQNMGDVRTILQISIFYGM